MKIKFFKPYITGNEIKYIKDLLENRRDLSGDGVYTKKVHSFLEKRYGVPKVFLTTSGTTALEFAVRLLDLKSGDEVIVPSFTFSSTANAVLMSSKAKLVFADIEKNTLNIDPADIEKKITKKTRAIIVVHYAGVACDMGKIMRIAKKHNLKVIEDAAQAIEAKYKDRWLGTIGDFGCISFHDTKNITCGEGGALFINSEDEKVIEKAEIIREKGTNRTKFFKGQVDKYTWMDVGSSILPSDILAAFLLAQLEHVEKITKGRLVAYEIYRSRFKKYEKLGLIRLPKIPSFAKHNGHIFYVIMNSSEERDSVLKSLRQSNIQASFHYIPLHSSPLGNKLGFKEWEMPNTEDLAKRLLRLPIYTGMKKTEINYVLGVFEEAMNELAETAGHKIPSRDFVFLDKFRRAKVGISV